MSKNLYRDSLPSKPTRSSLAENMVKTWSFANDKNVWFALFVLYFIGGSNYLAIKFALVSFPPFLMLGLRFFIAGTLLFTVLRLRGAAIPTRSELIGSAIVGTLILVGSFGGIAFAQQSVSSGIAAMSLATAPLWAALIAGFWGEWPSRLQWLGIVFGFAGVALLSLESNLRASPVGAVALLIGAMAFALSSVWSKRLTLPPGLMSSATQMLIGSGLLIVLSLSLGERFPVHITQSALLSLLYQIFFPSLMAYTALIYLLKQVHPVLASSFTYVHPIIAIVLGAILAREQIDGVGLSAIVITLLGVVLLIVKREKPQKFQN